RDYKVTGVQTCALPILSTRREIYSPGDCSVPISRALSAWSGARYCRNDQYGGLVITHCTLAGSSSRSTSAASPMSSWQVMTPTEIGRASCREGVEVGVG